MQTCITKKQTYTHCTYMQVVAWAGYIEIPETERTKLSAHLRASNVSDGKALWKLDAENFKSMAFMAGVSEERHQQVMHTYLYIYTHILMYMHVCVCAYVRTNVCMHRGSWIRNTQKI